MDENKVVETVEETEDIEIILKKPFNFEGTTYEKLILDFDKLTGQDLIKIEAEMNANNEFALTPETSPNYCARLAAAAAGVNAAVIVNLPLKDFNKAKNAARNFLVDVD